MKLLKTSSVFTVVILGIFTVSMIIAKSPFLNIQNEPTAVNQIRERVISDKKNASEGYVYYLLYCGTGCSGFRLKNTIDNTVYDGVLSYIIDNIERGEYVIFTDWHGHAYEFDGAFKDMDVLVKSEKAYITLQVVNTKGIITEREISISLADR